MTKQDMYSGLTFERAESPVAAAQTDNTAIVSEIIDMQGADAMLFVVLLGTLADAAFTTTFLMEDGDDSGLSDAAAVADDQLYGTEAGAAFDQDDDDKVRVIGYHGFKRYVRLTVTPADNTGNLPIAIVAVKNTKHKPSTQNA